MPENCTGVSLRDESKDFCKFNTIWATKKVGRKKLAKSATKKLPKQKSNIKNPKSICLVLEKDHHEFIQNQAMHKSVQEGFLIETNDIIREALQRAFPAPTQFDMFGGVKR